MILPRNGRIAVIDDKTEEEALPLLKALFKDGFSTVYFSGKSSELPPEPLKDIRVVFLDMELVPGSDVQTKAAATANILSHIIDTSAYSFYFLIIWATHDELLSPFWRYIRENPDYNCLFLTASLDKSECSAQDYDISFIKDEIERKLEGNDGFQFLMRWQNIIHQSSNDVTNEFLSLIKSHSDLNKQLLGVFKKLAIAYSGKVLDTGNNLQIEKDAMLAFNSTLKDSLERNISSITTDEVCFDNADLDIDDSTIASINSKLLLCETNVSPKPGNIYEIDDSGILKRITDEILDYCIITTKFATEIKKPLEEVCQNNKVVKIYTKDYERYCKKVRKQIREDQACKAIVSEISPLCDYAQQKWIYYRFLYGVIIPKAYTDYVQSAPFVYKTPILNLNGDEIFIVLNLRRIETKLLEEEIKHEYLCTMREDLISSIQHRFSSHCSRPGMVSL